MHPLSQPLQIVVAQKHELDRQGLHVLLQPEPGLEVVAEAGDGLVALDLVERLRPDVLVVDVRLPGLGGLELTRQAVRRSPRTRVVVLGTEASERLVADAFAEGASAYVLKETGISELLRAIQEVARGGRYLSPPFANKAVAAYIRTASTADAADDPYEALTPRERQVVHLAAEGLGNTSVAERLGISVRTAETHRARVLHKLGLRNQTELVHWAIRRGIIALGGRGPTQGD